MLMSVLQFEIRTNLLDNDEFSRDIRPEMQKALKRLKSALKRLEKQGIKVADGFASAPGQRHAFLTFTADDPALCSASQAAWEVGVYYSLLHELLFKTAEQLHTHRKGQKAGKAGAESVKSAADERGKEIRAAYKAWAGDSDNGKDWTSFPTDFAATKKKSRRAKKSGDLYGFSEPTIKRVIQEFHDEIVAECEKLRLGPMTPAKRNRHVFEALGDKPGISLEIVRRALE
jgi:hypothetical protein